jgi:hypothetical protein
MSQSDDEIPLEISNTSEYDITGRVKAVGIKVKKQVSITILDEEELELVDTYFNEFFEEIQMRDVFDNDNLKSPKEGNYSYAFHIYYQSYYGGGEMDFIVGDSFRGGFKSSLYLSYRTAMQELYRFFENYEIMQIIITGFGAEELKLPELGNFMQNGNYSSFTKHPYFAVGSRTRKNCFWNAVAIATSKISRELLTNNKKKSDYGCKLKKKMNHTDLDAPDEKSLKELANHFNRSIEIYDSLLKLKKKVDSFDGKNLKKDSIKIMELDSHAFALLPLKKIKDDYADLINEREVPIQVDRQFKLIEFDRQAYLRKKTSIKKIITWDLETTTKLFTSKQITYLCGYAYEWNDKIKFKSFEGEGCIGKWMEELFEERYFFNNYTLFAHNGSKFDILFLLYEYLHLDVSKWIIQNVCYHNGRIINLKIISKDKVCHLSFLDSYLFLCGSLERVGNELLPKNDEHNKKKNVDHWKICFENYKEFHELKPYFESDVVGLFKIIKIYSKTCLETNDLDLTRFCTGPALAVNSFLKNYYNPLFTPLYNPSIEFDNYIRHDYEGGRNEAFMIGKKTGKFAYLDVTSLYPYVGTFNLPFGKGDFFNTERLKNFIKNGKLTDDFFGFVQVKIKHTKIDEKQMNLIGFKSEEHQNRLIFPFFKNATQKVMFSEVIKFAQSEQLNYEFEFISGIKYDKAPVLKKFFEENFQKRKEAKLKGNDAEAQKRKIDMNSVYGKWGMKIVNRKSIKVSRTVPDFRKELKEGNLIALLKSDKYYYQEFFQHDIGKTCCISIAAAITAYAQLHLFKFMNEISRLGYHPDYCDTDSVIVDKFSFKNHPDLKKKFALNDGINLGEFKNEFEDKAKKSLKKEVFEELKKNDDLYFDNLIILGNKSYIISRKIGDVIIKSQAQKGISESLRPKLEEYEKILEKKIYVPGFENKDQFFKECVDMDNKKIEKNYAPQQNVKEEIIDGKKRKYFEEEYECHGKKKIRKCCLKEVGQILFRTNLNNILIEHKESQGIKIDYVKKKINLKYYKGIYSNEEIKKNGYSRIIPFCI